MLDQALANADARRRGCALMIIDLDRFKQVNDTLGHPIGDKLLKKVAGRLAKVLGEDGQVGRLGGDEFEAILPGIEEEGRLSELAGRLIEQVSKPYKIEGHEILIGTSVGIAVAVPGKTLAEGLIKDADVALYAAKADGRGTFRFFAQEMHAQATERQILETDLRYALANDQLTLVYQPIVDSVSEEVVAFEALLRWHHPGRGLLPPALVIPLAEETGLMPRIGDWVLRTACTQAAKWPKHIRVAVNLSPVQFADPALAATVTGTLAASQLDPERLELEINEAVFLADRKRHRNHSDPPARPRGPARSGQFRYRPLRASAICATRRSTRSRSTRASSGAPPHRAAATAPSSGPSSSSPRALEWTRPPRAPRRSRSCR